MIIGYGNPLREDDGAGRHAAELVRRSLAPDVARVIECHQLTPELALEVEDASLVIFLDAALGRDPGAIALRDVLRAESSAWSHQLTPAQLLSLAENAPPAYAITCGVSSTGWHEGLTAQGVNSAAKMAAAALTLLREPKPRAAVPASYTTRPAPCP